jgi:malonyl-CoA O-methyltransferase
MPTPSSVPNAVLSPHSRAIPEFLAQEVAQRMAEKLEIVRLQPKKIGHFGELNLSVLASYYPESDHHCFDQRFSSNVLTQFFKKITRQHFYRYQAPSDIGAADFDLIWSNLELHLQDDPNSLMKKWKNKLKPEGLLMFSYLGPDTGKDLAKLFRNDCLLRNAGSLDMHDVGDGLMRAGFSEPVMDMEYLTLSYDEAHLLCKEAFNLGLLTSPDSVQSLIEAPSHLTITLEVVYGHAWAPDALLAQKKAGITTISPDQIVRSKK